MSALTKVTVSPHIHSGKSTSGVMRDVLAGTVPSIFRKHIYALASAAGALADILLMGVLPGEIAMTAGFMVVVVVRLLAVHFHWNLPRIE